jgi:lysozyme family protein
MPTYSEEEKKKLRVLWDTAVIRPDKINEARAQVKDHLIRNKSRYELVSKATGVPWFAIAAIHFMESDCNFSTHLHNGDKLTARTVQVPAGRPVAGNPPFTWEESAIDALGYDHFVGETDWSVEHLLFLWEKYNGFGYRNHNCLSPYVWAGTTVQTKGRYVADGKFDPESISNRIGCAAMLKVLIELGEVSFDSAKPAEPKPIPSSDAPNNPKGIIGIVINSVDFSDIRALDANGKTYYFETGITLEMLYLSALSFGCPRVKIASKMMNKRPVITSDNIPTYQVNK